MTLNVMFQKMQKRVKRIFTRQLTHQEFLIINKRNKFKKCVVCGEEFESFAPYRIHLKNLGAISYFKIIGSDTLNFCCYYCHSTDRDRHLFMYFEKLSLWDKFQNATVLHFAPERAIEKKITSLNPTKYIKGDLYPKEDWIKVDITDIHFENESIDIIICNHVLEHVPDHLKAISEIYRVLKPGGFAVLQTPVSDLLFHHFSDPNINTDELRLSFYGQEDHVKVVSKRELYEELSQKFKLSIVKHSDYFNQNDALVNGVNYKEDLMLVVK